MGDEILPAMDADDAALSKGPGDNLGMGKTVVPAKTPEQIAAEAGPGSNLKGGKRIPMVGSRAQVMNGNAHHTPGGLTKAHLKYNKYGRIVSAKKSALAKKKGTLKKWEKKTGVKWTIKKGKPVKVKHGRA